jgi:apocytochrome f
MSVKKIHLLIYTIILICLQVLPVTAYPIFAQQNYANPREANGRIVCANCHLAQKPVDLEVPQAVLPDTVFEAIVRIPYDQEVKQVLRNGKLGDLNVGAVLILPDNYQLAPPNRMSPTIKERVGNLYFQPYSAERKNILVVGPVPGKKYQRITFPILAPDPNTNKRVNYLKDSIYLGGNRGRGQVYPDGSKSNNTVYTSSATGVVKEITPGENKGGFRIVLESSSGNTVVENIPPGPELMIKTGQSVRVDEPLTTNPNVGGFGQAESEIVLQNPRRIKGLLIFYRVVFLTQVLLVLKKKQFEKVQLLEITF